MTLSDTWNVRHVALFPVYVLLRIEPRASCLLGKHATNSSTFPTTNPKIAEKEIIKKISLIVAIKRKIKTSPKDKFNH